MSVLLVSFSAEEQAALCRILEHPNWELHGRPDRRRALAYLHGRRVPVVMCEHDRRSESWRNFLNSAQKLPFPPSVIVCTRAANEYLWADVLSLGGDVLVKPFATEEVLRVVYTAWQSWKRRCLEPARRANKRRTFSAGSGGL